jgi:hypothetical protein
MSEPMTSEKAIQYWTDFRKEAIDMIANGEDKGDQLKEQIPMCDIVLSALSAQQKKCRCQCGERDDSFCETCSRIRVQAIKEKLVRENPQPLTLKELKERAGKPVWTVTNGVVGSGRWEIVDFQKPQYDDREVLTLANLSDGLYDCFADNYGKTWIAYDHEPKEATNAD